jgi:ribonuclease HI
MMGRLCTLVCVCACERASPHAYADGCCHNNGRRHPRGGIGVFWGDAHTLNTSAPLPVDGAHTNNRAEILAVVHALKQVRT